MTEAIIIIVTVIYMLIGFGFAKVSAAATNQKVNVAFIVAWPLAALVSAFVFDHD